jgi:uncharacterized protein (TIGR02271 family)
LAESVAGYLADMDNVTRNTRDDFGAAPVAGTAEVVRSEERLLVGTRSHVVGRLRIAKRVVTEERVVTVTVRREELVVEQLPGADGQASLESLLVEQAAHGGDRADRTAGPAVDLWLSEEEVEVTTRVVPRERVRVYVDTVTAHVPVSGTVAREVVDVEATGSAQVAGDQMVLDDRGTASPTSTT